MNPGRAQRSPHSWSTLGFREARNRPLDCLSGPLIIPEVTLAGTPAVRLAQGHIAKCQGPQRWESDSRSLFPINSRRKSRVAAVTWSRP